MLRRAMQRSQSRKTRIDLEVMVARAERAYLVAVARLRVLRHFVRVDVDCNLGGCTSCAQGSRS
jgi:hypothetical protein